MRTPDLPLRLGCILSLGLAVGVLAGCQSAGGYAGAVGGVAAAGASANPAVGIGVGIAIRAGTDALFDAVFRHMQTREQDRIAAQAGSLPVGQVVSWNAQQIWPLPNEQGNMQVIADVDNALSPCRVVLFSVLTKKQRAAGAPGPASDTTGVKPDANPAAPLAVQWFQTTVCRRSDNTWKWAQSEPATERWGNLQ